MSPEPVASWFQRNGRKGAMWPIPFGPPALRPGWHLQRENTARKSLGFFWRGWKKENKVFDFTRCFKTSALWQWRRNTVIQKLFFCWEEGYYFSFWVQPFLLPVTRHKSWTPESKVDLRNSQKTEKLTFLLRREGWGVFSPLWNLKGKTWVACHGKETRSNLNRWSCPRQHPHKSTMRNRAGSSVLCTPSITSSRTAMPSPGKRCKRFSRGRDLPFSLGSLYV